MDAVFSIDYYTTSIVTAYALSPTSAANTSRFSNSTPSSSAHLFTAAAYAAGLSCANENVITITTTAPTPTTTITATYTISKAYRGTTTVPACQPTANYGLFNGTLNVNYVGPIGQPATVSFPNLAIADCCMECFTSDGGCLSWAFDGVGTCSLSVVDGECPSSSGTESLRYPNDEKPAVGVGPCDVVVGYFVDG